MVKIFKVKEKIKCSRERYTLLGDSYFNPIEYSLRLVDESGEELILKLFGSKFYSIWKENHFYLPMTDVGKEILMVQLESGERCFYGFNYLRVIKLNTLG